MLRSSHRLPRRKGSARRGNNSRSWAKSKAHRIRQRSRKSSYRRISIWISSSTRQRLSRSPTIHGSTQPQFTSRTMHRSISTNRQLSSRSCLRVVWVILSRASIKILRKRRTSPQSQASETKQQLDGVRQLEGRYRRSLLYRKTLAK